MNDVYGRVLTMTLLKCRLLQEVNDICSCAMGDKPPNPLRPLWRCEM